MFSEAPPLCAALGMMSRDHVAPTSSAADPGVTTGPCGRHAGGRTQRAETAGAAVCIVTQVTERVLL